MPAPRAQSLAQILGIPIEVSIVDVGANLLGEEAPMYQSLLDDGVGRVTGFEPNPEACAELEQRKGPRETYLPYAVGDGTDQTLRLCRMSGMSSLLMPNFKLLDMLHLHGQWAVVEREVPMATRRLDELVAVPTIDYLKIDIQGGELMVFQGAREKLSRALVVHTETMFVPMYVDQPLFSEQEQFLREIGFAFHRFYVPPGDTTPLKSHVLKPLIVNDNPESPLSQVFWADSIFIRDLTRLDEMAPEALLKMALILHNVYFSFDVVVRCLMAFDAQIGTAHFERYLASMGG